MIYGIFGNRGAYRMPYTPHFIDLDTAVSYLRVMWPDNKHVIVLPLN